MMKNDARPPDWDEGVTTMVDNSLTSNTTDAEAGVFDAQIEDSPSDLWRSIHANCK